MTYNILDGSEDRLNLIAQIVNQENPDIFTLNEANGFNLNDNERLKLFGAMTKTPYYHLALSGKHDYHVAIYSKLPPVSVEEIHPLTRAGIRLVVNSSIGEIAIVGTHLSPYSEADRIPEIDLILSSLNSFSNQIILGDLNSLANTDNYQQDQIIPSFTSSQIRKFTDTKQLLFDVVNRIKHHGYIDTGLASQSEMINTVPTNSNKDTSHSKLRLDYIFTSDPLSKKVTNYRVVKNAMTELASDHYPVVLDLNV